MYIHNEILVSPKKRNEILPFVTTWIHIEGITLNELSKTEISLILTKSDHIISLICGIFKKRTNEQINKQTLKYRE